MKIIMMQGLLLIHLTIDFFMALDVLLSNMPFADISCFQGLFFCSEASSLLLHNFCIYHISPLRHEIVLSDFHNSPCGWELRQFFIGPCSLVDDLADQIVEVLNYVRSFGNNLLIFRDRGMVCVHFTLPRPYIVGFHWE
ncbi:uncharacterized protein LOC132609185 isoform X2 [Lycium barbarum]|uniref:uncharacterized protein LOC132609185 isoform X2 n=1 Tax=Lycium barbarum TaxID=112863 RepID=UPI00293F706D|nr:uncharacterized protein LOC132609185 isoform X2 [Lycium barbarum]